MELKAGEYVVYGAAGLCRYVGTEKKSFDGISENEYFKLIPAQSQTSTYYVPADTADTKLRKLISKEEIYALIDNMPAEEPIWLKDSHERKAMFSSVLKSDDYGKIISMLKALHLQREKRLSGGKKLTSADERAMKSAEEMMYREFGAVLNIHPENVSRFISDRLDGISTEKAAE